VQPTPRNTFNPATLPPVAVQTFHIPEFQPAQLRWYCCLGTGEDPSQVPVENEVTAAFGTAFPGSTLKFEVTTYDAAVDTLSTQISGTNSPDVVGPVGIGGLAAFQGQWLDLAPFIAKSHYDLGQYDPTAVNFYKTADGQIGIPFDVYPSMVWYKKDMFEEAGIAEPPHTYNSKYKLPDGTEVDWNYDTLRQIALKLTVDKNNKDATEAGFDPTKIVQYGFEPQRDDLRGLGAYWGPGNLAGGADGHTVVIPDAWKVAWKFYYDGMWKDHFIMTFPVFESAAFGGGEYPFFSGRVAMSENFLWTTYGVANAGTDWDLAAIPSYNGTTTSPFNGDTFTILKGSKNPDAAFAAVTFILDESADKLTQLYGGMPTRPDRQDAFFEQLGQSEGFPDKVDWQVVKDSLQYADSPNWEAAFDGLPATTYNETLTILHTYLTKWGTKSGLDMDAEIDALQKEIQAAWDK
jgi:multiple sugar transport system substrate-binding protein